MHAAVLDSHRRIHCETTFFRAELASLRKAIDFEEEQGNAWRTVYRTGRAGGLQTERMQAAARKDTAPNFVHCNRYSMLEASSLEASHEGCDSGLDHSTRPDTLRLQRHSGEYVHLEIQPQALPGISTLTKGSEDYCQRRDHRPFSQKGGEHSNFGHHNLVQNFEASQRSSQAQRQRSKEDLYYEGKARQENSKMRRRGRRQRLSLCLVGSAYLQRQETKQGWHCEGEVRHSRVHKRRGRRQGQGQRLDVGTSLQQKAQDQNPKALMQRAHGSSSKACTLAQFAKTLKGDEDFFDPMEIQAGGKNQYQKAHDSI